MQTIHLFTRRTPSRTLLHYNDGCKFDSGGAFDIYKCVINFYVCQYIKVCSKVMNVWV